MGNFYQIKTLFMKKTRFFICFLMFATAMMAQREPLPVPNVGGNKKAMIAENIGVCEVKIQYHRPGVKGREGKIYGTGIAHYGFQDLGFGSSKAAPWRAGANENTIISFSTDVKIGGQPLAAGQYGLSMALGETESIVVFSKKSDGWGSYFYNSADDALRVTVKNQMLTSSEEWLSYTFTNQKDNAADVALTWEKRRIAFTVEVDMVKTQFESFASALKMPKGFGWQTHLQAANFCLQNNYRLEQALEWANIAVNPNAMGQKNFQTLSTKAQILEKLGKTAEANSTLTEAMAVGDMNDVHAYARQLLNNKKVNEAFAVFKQNYDKHPTAFTTNVGIGRAYSAMGNYPKALEHIKFALPLAPNPANKESIEKMIKTLEMGKDIN
jgi:Protein of unknown function (DUF2911)